MAKWYLMVERPRDALTHAKVQKSLRRGSQVCAAAFKFACLVAVHFAITVQGCGSLALLYHVVPFQLQLDALPSVVSDRKVSASSKSCLVLSKTHSSKFI